MMALDIIQRPPQHGGAKKEIGPLNPTATTRSDILAEGAPALFCRLKSCFYGRLHRQPSATARTDQPPRPPAHADHHPLAFEADRDDARADRSDVSRDKVHRYWSLAESDPMLWQ